MGGASHDVLLAQTVVRIAAKCPRLVASCYWAGTSAIALEELGHRQSFDLDFHTQEPLVDTRPVLTEIDRAFPRSLEIVRPPDAHGSGFTGLLKVSRREKLTLQVFGGFERVPERDLVRSATAPRLRRVTVRRYLWDKVQCVVERIEARDLVDIAAVVRHAPRMQLTLRRAIATQDALLLAERLLGWTDSAIREDLRAYADVEPKDAIAMRDRLLRIVRSSRKG